MEIQHNSGFVCRRQILLSLDSSVGGGWRCCSVAIGNSLQYNYSDTQVLTYKYIGFKGKPLHKVNE